MSGAYGFPKKENINLPDYEFAEDLVAGDVVQAINLLDSNGIGLAKAHNKFTGAVLQGDNMTNSNSRVQSVALDDTRVLVVWGGISGGVSLHGRVVSRNTSSWAVTNGGSFEIGSSLYSMGSFRLCKIATDKVAIAFADFNDSQKPYVIVITLSGTSLTGTGTKVKLADTAVSSESMCLAIESHDTNKFVVAYNTSSNVQVRVGTVSGTAVTLITATNLTERLRGIGGTATNPLDIVIRDSSHFSLVISGQSEIFHGTINGDNTITVVNGGLAMPHHSGTNCVKLLTLSSTKGILWNGNSGGFLSLMPFIISNGKITCGTPTKTDTAFGTPYNDSYKFARLDNDRFVVVSAYSNGDAKLTVCQVESSNTITAGTPSTFKSFGSDYNTTAVEVICPTTSKAIVVFANSSNRYMLARACTISGTTVSGWGTEASYNAFVTMSGWGSGLNTSYCKSLGLAKIRDGYFMTVYKYYTNSQTYALIFSSADGGTSITFEGVPVSIDADYSDTNWNDATYIADNVVLAHFGTKGCYLRVLTVSGTTITARARFSFGSSEASYTNGSGRSTGVISATKFFLTSTYTKARLTYYSIDGSYNISYLNSSFTPSTYEYNGLGSESVTTSGLSGAFELFPNSTTQGIFMNIRLMLSIATLTDDIPSWDMNSLALSYPPTQAQVYLCRLNSNALFCYYSNQAISSSFSTLLMNGESHSLVAYKAMHQLGLTHNPYQNGKMGAGVLVMGDNSVVIIGKKNASPQDIVMVQLRFNISGEFILFHNNIAFSTGTIINANFLASSLLGNNFVLTSYINNSDYYAYSFFSKITPYIEHQLKDGANGTGIVQSSGIKGTRGLLAQYNAISNVHSGLSVGKNYYYDPTTFALSLTKPSNVLSLLVGVAISATELLILARTEGRSETRKAVRIDSGSGLNYFTFVNGYLTNIESS